MSRADDPSVPAPAADEAARLRTELRRAQVALEASYGRLRRLVAAQEAVREDERKRIARELHDELQQALAAIRLELSGVAGLLPGTPELARAQLAVVDGLVGSALVSTRRMINDLRPQVLDDLGLVAALESLASHFRQRAGVPCVFRADEGLDDLTLPPEVATCLYRVAQEGLQNVAKHAGAGRVTLSLALEPGRRLAMAIVDDGRGVTEGDQHKEHAWGLLGMRERVQGLSGELRVTGLPGRGTRIDAVVPVGGAERGPPALDARG